MEKEEKIEGPGTALTIDDLANFIEEKGLAKKPYNVTLTPSLRAYLLAVQAGIEGGELPPGTVEIEKERVDGFRKLYGFDYVTQASRAARERGEAKKGKEEDVVSISPDEVVTGTRYGNMLVLGSPNLPEGSFYVQHLRMVDGGMWPVSELAKETISLRSLVEEHFYIRHFVTSVYDYSSGKWPDGWYRMRRDTRVDEVTFVRGGRCSHGKGMPLLWATNMQDGNNYSFEPVVVFDTFDAAFVREALTNTLYAGKREWYGETEWENVEERIEEVMAKMGGKYHNNVRQ